MRTASVDDATGTRASRSVSGGSPSSARSASMRPGHRVEGEPGVPPVAVLVLQQAGHAASGDHLDIVDQSGVVQGVARGLAQVVVAQHRRTGPRPTTPRLGPRARAGARGDALLVVAGEGAAEGEGADDQHHGGHDGEEAGQPGGHVVTVVVTAAIPTPGQTSGPEAQAPDVGVRRAARPCGLSQRRTRRSVEEQTRHAGALTVLFAGACRVERLVGQKGGPRRCSPFCSRERAGVSAWCVRNVGRLGEGPGDLASGGRRGRLGPGGIEQLGRLVGRPVLRRGAADGGVGALVEVGDVVGHERGEVVVGG